ncbi:hypothetical protein V7100_17485 [Priestia megaterium]|uniref:hypothetical protein n=1 Tax=Priestia megaterium TaxID=1404 RepID=UPI003000B4FF
MYFSKIGKLSYVALGVIGIILAVTSYIDNSYFLKYLALVLLGLSLMLNGYVTYLRWNGKEPFVYITIGIVVVIIALGELIRIA